MSKFIVVAVIAILLTGCAAMPDQQKRALVGAAVGAGVGALVGSAVATGPGAIAVGAVVGGTVGGIVAAYAKPLGCYVRNRRGELWQVPCEDTRVRSKACFVGHGPGALDRVYCPWDRRGG